MSSPTPTPSNRQTHSHSRSHSRPPTSGSGHKQSPFEQQREELVGEIALSLEQVLQNLNQLNRNLEGVIAVGNEFSSVEALWSQFENVMGRNGEGEGVGMGTGGTATTATAGAGAGASGDVKGEDS